MIPTYLEAFEDEVDAVISESDYAQALEIFKESDQLEEVIDTDLSYANDTITADGEEILATDIIAAEREIMHNPMEEDELIDAAIGDDADKDISEFEDETDDITGDEDENITQEDIDSVSISDLVD